jgi:phosphate uptake regulator
MRRKLIKQGMGGLTMSIPKKWIEKNGLKPGEEIDLEESEQGLNISPVARKRVKELNIDIEEEDASRIRTMISSAYRRGYDKITLTSKKGFPFRGINRIVDSLTGFTITEQGDKRIVIKNIMAEDFEDVPAILNKLFMTIVFFNSSTIQFLEDLEKDASDEKELEELSKSIIRLRDYCQRSIHLATYGGDKSYEYNVLVVAEKFAGNLKTAIAMKKHVKSADIKRMTPRMKELAKRFTELKSALIKKHAKKAIQLNNRISRMKNEIYLEKDTNKLVCAMAENLFSISSRVVSILV